MEKLLMPWIPCGDPTCPKLVEDTQRRYCEKHSSQADPRPSAHKRGYTRGWRRERAIYLQENPICLDPFGDHAPVLVPAGIVDHALPHRGRDVVFWTRELWGSLCVGCHSKKTISVDRAIPESLDENLFIILTAAATVDLSPCQVICSAVQLARESRTETIKTACLRVIDERHTNDQSA